MMNAEQCWEAILKRDPAFDGLFFFGVRSTGIFCRPSCPARRPLRQNVRFYSTPEGAQQDGLRPCRRCHPLEALPTNLSKIHELCRYIEAHASEPLTLGHLAEHAGLSRFHLQRTFQAVVGLSPKRYLDACRMRSLKHELKRGNDVMEAVYEAGFGSSSRVYERAGRRLGMTPGRYRQGGRDLHITYATAQSPLGLLLIAATGQGICFVQFGATEEALIAALRQEYPDARLEAMRAPNPEFRQWMEALNAYLAGEPPRLDLPLDVRATAFQMRVWNFLQSIPYGDVLSYQQVAAAIGRPSAARAVAGACACNRVALLIPCHRVIRGSGDLGGYRWGVNRKRKLLELERAYAQPTEITAMTSHSIRIGSTRSRERNV
jgi:AraC family transcriptional regulator, regulatory protein of adaptative response / methylated-DNA-[protein]-cysteine methyltransferase